GTLPTNTGPRRPTWTNCFRASRAGEAAAVRSSLSASPAISTLKTVPPSWLLIWTLTKMTLNPSNDLRMWADGRRFATILADPPWRFQNSTGKVAPEHRRLSRYGTLSLREIEELPVAELTQEPAHLYLWVPNALLAEGLTVMSAWGFTYKSNIVWHKVRKDGGSDGRGVGFYYRTVTEI